MKVTWRLILLEASRRRKNFFFVLSFLFLGFISLWISLGLRASNQLFILTQSRVILTSDLQISSSRPLSSSELNHIVHSVNAKAFSQDFDFFATINFSGSPQMVEVRAVDERFPLVGSFVDKDIRDKLLDQPRALLPWSLREQFDLKLDSRFKIGQSEFYPAGFTSSESTLGGGLRSVLPQVFISKDSAALTGLVQPLSQVRYRTNFLLPIALNKNQLTQKIGDLAPDLTLQTPEDAVRGIERGLVVLERYLSLMTLLIALVSFVAAFYFLQIQLSESTKNYAIYLLYGAGLNGVFRIVLGSISLQIIVAGTLALFAVSLIGFGLNLSAILPMGYKFLFNSRALGLMFFILSAMIICFFLPLRTRISRLEIISLLEGEAPSLPSQNAKVWLIYGFSSLAFFFFCGWLLGSWVMALVFALSIFLALSFAIYLIPRLAGLFARKVSRAPLFRLSLLNLSRPRLLTSLLFVAITWSALVANIIPSLYSLAQSELRPPETADLPSLFLINIPEDNLTPLNGFVQENAGRLSYLSPLILARVIRVNGDSLKDSRLTRFPVRLTYRDRLIESERIVEGLHPNQPFDPDSGLLAQFTIEKDFAERNNLKIGDVVDFEIAGFEVKAKISAFREVKWNSFQPNFFMQFQTGVLEEFPKSYIGVIYGISGNKIFGFQNQLTEKFPNLSSLNLYTTLERLAELVNQLYRPIMGITIIAILLVGLMASGVNIYQTRKRDQEWKIYSLFGGTWPSTLKVLLCETSMTSLMAIALGLALSLVLSNWLAKWLFDTTAPFNAPWLLASILGLFLVSVFSSTLALKR